MFLFEILILWILSTFDNSLFAFFSYWNWVKLLWLIVWSNISYFTNIGSRIIDLIHYWDSLILGFKWYDLVSYVMKLRLCKYISLEGSVDFVHISFTKVFMQKNKLHKQCSSTVIGVPCKTFFVLDYLCIFIS